MSPRLLSSCVITDYVLGPPKKKAQFKGKRWIAQGEYPSTEQLPAQTCAPGWLGKFASR
jgi:hypothetical protein